MPSRIPGQRTIAFAIPHFRLSQAPPSPTALRFHFWILTKNCSPALALPRQPPSTTLLPIATFRLPIGNGCRRVLSIGNWKSAIRNSFLLGHLRRVRTVFSKHACRRKFAELVTYHILSDKNGTKGLPVVHQKRVADKVRRHHRASRPGLNRFLDARRVHLVDLFKKMRLDEGSFL